MTIDVLYLHGFASSPASAKITALRPRVEPHGIRLDTPDLNVPTFETLDWDAVVDRALDHARRTPPRAIAASSMGALVALTLVQRGVEVPLVLIAPAFGVAKRWLPRLPTGDALTVFNFARNANATIHRRFFDQIVAIEPEAQVPPVRTTILMGRDDETVAFVDVESVWNRWRAHGVAAGSKFIEIPDGDHGLTEHVDRIAAELVEAVA
ncbi:MAG: hypothetical protein JOZ54_14415 [Acidobacteria bacterium]|nr:hypothetical protein [Acidobacteriota bacterium]